jgi:hypothetical protein
VLKPIENKKEFTFSNFGKEKIKRTIIPSSEGTFLETFTIT